MQAPVDALQFFVDDAGNLCAFEVGSGKIFMVGAAAAIGEAPADGNTYVRQDQNWTPVAIPAQQLVITGVQPGGGTESTPVSIDVQGSGFSTNSVINWGGYPMATTFISATELQAQLNLGPGSAGTYTLVVTDGGQQSNSVAFVVSPAGTIFVSDSVSLKVNADEDLIFTQSKGPNAGKSVNLTYGKWT